MSPRLVLVAVALIAGIAVLLFATGERGAGPSRTGEEQSGNAGSPAALVASPETTVSASEPVRRESAPEVEARPTEASAAPTGFHRLRGSVRHSSDGRPAAGAVLVLRQGERSEEVVADEHGRFETRPGFPSGPLNVWHRGDWPDPDWTEHREVRPAELLLADPGTDNDFEPVELVLLDPAAWVEVEVVSPSGAPTQAMLSWFFQPPGGVGATNAAPSDAQGRARLPFPSVEAGARMLVLARAGERVSDWARIDAPPGDELVQLVLGAGGSLRVRALEADGRPRAGQGLALESDDPARPFALGGIETDAAGEARIDGLPPGLLGVRFWSPEVSRWVAATVEVVRGASVAVELRVPDVPIAVAGVVLDADDRPVAGVALIAGIGDVNTTTHSDAQGRFSISSSERGAAVLLQVDLGLQDDRFEPRALAVPFGTRDVVFRRRALLPQVTLVLEIVDRASGARIPDGLVLGFVDPDRSSWSFHHVTDGHVTLEVKPYEDAGLAIESRGYRRRILRPAELLRDAPAGAPVRVALESGLERWLCALDESDGRPLIGARILDGEREVATTDGEGRALVDLASWPKELRVLAAGHEEGRWDCGEWLAELGDGVVWLQPAPEGASDR